MGKCKEPSIILDELETQAHSVLGSVASIRRMFTTEEKEPTLYDDGYEETEIYVKKLITLEKVIQVLAEISRDRKTAQVSVDLSMM